MKRNLAENEVKVSSLEEAAARLGDDYNIRMRSDQGRYGLYSPKSDEFTVDDR